MDKIKAAVIYLASGNSKRFGQENKLLQMIGTKPMYRYGLDRLIDLCKDYEGFEIIVVTQYQEIMKQTQYDPITTVFCPESKYDSLYIIFHKMYHLFRIQNSLLQNLPDQEDFLLQSV